MITSTMPLGLDAYFASMSDEHPAIFRGSGLLGRDDEVCSNVIDLAAERQKRQRELGHAG